MRQISRRAMETCRWCTASPENDVAVIEVLKRYCTGQMSPKEKDDANSDFIYCLECVVKYHQAREMVPALHKRLWELETARLLEVFRKMLEADLEDDDLFFVENGYEQRVSAVTPEEFHNQLRFPLMEVLKYPYLLCHKELCEMVVDVICKMEDMKNPLPVHDQYQGTYLLMVHPNEIVRRWAIATARSLGRVDRDNYYDLQEVFSCMFYVIDLGITVDFLNMDDSYYSGKMNVLQPHLFDSKNKKSYWLGICMLLMQLDSQAMDSLLMGPEGQTSIPQCIINTMNDCNKDDDLDPFWPALHCFLVILDRLGSKIWGQIEPLDAFKAITKAGSYIAKIENIREQTAGTRVKVEPENHDDLMSCSQIVYGCYTTERTSRLLDCSSGNSDTSGNAIFEEMSCLVNVLQSEMGQSMRVYGSTFLWFIPFVRSLMELTALNSICIGEVIHYLENNVDKNVLSGRIRTCDKVTEFFIRILVDVINLHLSNGCMERLSYFTHIWVDMVMQCATLSDDFCTTRGVYSTSHFGRGTQMPAVGVGAMSQACTKLIRSLLKEGGRTGTVPESAHFLDIINRHLRGLSSKGWNLPKSEYENLKKCLVRLVKVITERSAVSNDVLPCAPPTPPSDPFENVISYPSSTLTPPLQQVETKDALVGPCGPAGTTNFIKDEPPWDHGECQSFFDGHEEMINVKKEPYNQTPISESRPHTEGIHITPGKLQEIRSRLTVQNLSKIQAIAKRRFKTEDEQGECSGMKEIVHASSVSPQPSTSKSKVPDTARLSKSLKKELNDDNDDEPLDVQRNRLKRSLQSSKEDSTDTRQISIQLSSTAKQIHESSIITISDDEVSSNGQNLLEKMDARDPVLDLDSSKSPGRDYDDLSESQVFEFETQAHMASVWNEPHSDITGLTKKHELENDSKACSSHHAVEPMQTQPVSDEDTEKACLHVEAQICKQQQPQKPISSSMWEPPMRSSNENCDFIKSNHSKGPTEKTALPEKKGKQWLSKKPPVIAPLSQKIKKRCWSHDTISKDPVKPCSSTMLTSTSVESPSTAAPSRGSCASFVVPPSTAAPSRGSCASSVTSPSTAAPSRGSCASSVASPSTAAPSRGSCASSVTSPSTAAPSRGSCASSVTSPSTAAPSRGSCASSVTSPSTAAPSRGSCASPVASPSTAAPSRGPCASSVASPSTAAPSRGSCASSVASPSTTAPSRGSSASTVAPLRSTPAIVPPKKVRKRVAPELPAELLGLKKKERKAFDFSQRSLVSLGKLRSHGQNVHVEPQQKSKRLRKHKVGVKKGKKLLASQDLQYFRQRRSMLQKPTSATPVVAKSNQRPVPENLPKLNSANETVEEPEDEEDDYSFLPCSQPDPDRRMDNKTDTTQVNTSLSNDSKKAISDWESSKSKDFSSLQNNKCAGGSMAEGAESREENFDDEWMSFTQNEPTDMELCSQMEQMEEQYFENIMVTGCARMDNDSGNQPNISEAITSVPLKPVTCNTLQKPLPDASTSTTTNDHLFVNPNMLTECQKKAKPTTKIYNKSCSRTAFLAKEMGKVANPVPAANVAKAKVARPPPSMPPPPAMSSSAMPPPAMPSPLLPKTTTLLPRPILHTANQASKSFSNVTFASHVPSYKTYARPETPVSVQTPTMDQGRRFDNSPVYDQFYLKRAILKWEFRMFENYKSFGAPQDLCPFRLKEVPTTFSSCTDYFNTLYPLLLLNTFEEMVNEWYVRKIRIELKVQGIEYSNRVATASFTASLNAEQEVKQLYPKDEDLVLLYLPENIGAYANDEQDVPDLCPHFGCVLRSSVLNNGGQFSTLNITIQTFGNVSSVNTQSVRCELIGSLVSTLREFRALNLLPKSKMMHPLILKPDIKFYAPCQDGLPNIDMPEYNSEQAKAISCGVAMVKRKQNTPKILLIHGPPGTGKSKIIVGMLHRLLSDPVSLSASRRPRILLCTPSNAAIDNLMKKIIIVFKEKCMDIRSPQGNCGDIKLVRLGSERAISKELKPFSLDCQVRKVLEKAQHKGDLDIQRKKEELDKKIEMVSQQCALTDKKSNMFEQLNNKKMFYLNERKNLSRQLNELRNKKQSVQSRLLLDAHVICCTLSTSGSGLLESAFRRLGHEPFSCVIIDEAGQAKETETLIPLLYRCQNLILVGDPMQLPPTVVSQKAKELGYDQSLMARVWKSLFNLNTHLSPSIFLRVQYRMHPDICEFPSKYIYNNNLKSDPETAQKLCSISWPFEAYRVFDVTDGKERKQGDSYSNAKEVKLVVVLYKLLGENHAKRKEKQQMRIGIITPYNAQKQRITEALDNDIDKELKKGIHVEVDTVDGFQGREMDCIIVSCVRASSENGSIGFVANRQRMNVTITRAKSSLYILGHLRTLTEHSDWGALVRDAEKRGARITVNESNFHKVVREVLKPSRPSRRSTHPPIPMSNPACSDGQRDPRTHDRPSDPRLPAPLPASREQDIGNQGFTRPRPPGRSPLDPRRDRSFTRSFRSTSEQHHEHHSSSSRTHRK
ncbi:probable helicase senataxin isoform X1 [Hemibagrus wyckioides]|uniref:probable helicase senataxin isoform X1 n=1 Tax=Hemibagrus wyckioides TaxID=337641 RepID=UPI00266BEE5F|nr:probable helicase senataxin isoform X1 [Hemibagrus wyckioides]